MESKFSSYRLRALRIMVRLLVRFALAGKHTLQEFIEVLKHAYVELAVAEFEKKSKKVNVSRISMMTGLHRQELNRIYKGLPVGKKEPNNLVGRIVMQWAQDSRFTTKDRKP